MSRFPFTPLDWSDPASWTAAYKIGWPRNRLIRLGYHRAVLFPEAARRAGDLIRKLGLTDRSSVVVVGAAYGWTVEAMAAAVPGIKVVGTDISSLIHTEKAKTETADYEAAIVKAGLDPKSGDGAAHLALMDDGGTRGRTTVVNEDGESAGSMTAIKDALGSGTVDWVITEGVLQGFTDAEAAAWATKIGGMAANVLHILTPRASIKDQDTGAEIGQIDSDGSVFATIGGRRVQKQAGIANWKWMHEWRTLLDAAGLTAHKLTTLNTRELV